MKKCEAPSCSQSKLKCFRGFPEGECPLRRLENEKLIFGALLSFATGLLVWLHF